jgi:hypothetical protein
MLLSSLLIDLVPEGTRTNTLLSVYGELRGLTGPVWIFTAGPIVDSFGIAPALYLRAVSYIGSLALLGLIKPNPRQQELWNNTCNREQISQQTTELRQ